MTDPKKARYEAYAILRKEGHIDMSDDEMEKNLVDEKNRADLHGYLVTHYGEENIGDFENWEASHFPEYSKKKDFGESAGPSAVSSSATEPTPLAPTAEGMAQPSTAKGILEAQGVSFVAPPQPVQKEVVPPGLEGLEGIQVTPESTALPTVSMGAAYNDAILKQQQAYIDSIKDVPLDVLSDPSKAFDLLATDDVARKLHNDPNASDYIKGQLKARTISDAVTKISDKITLIEAGLDEATLDRYSDAKAAIIEIYNSGNPETLVGGRNAQAWLDDYDMLLQSEPSLAEYDSLNEKMYALGQSYENIKNINPAYFADIEKKRKAQVTADVYFMTMSKPEQVARTFGVGFTKSLQEFAQGMMGFVGAVGNSFGESAERYDWADKLAERAATMDGGWMNTIPSFAQRNIFTNTARVGNYQIDIDNNGLPSTVRDAAGFVVTDSDTVKQITDQYESAPDKYDIRYRPHLAPSISVAGNGLAQVLVTSKFAGLGRTVAAAKGISAGVLTARFAGQNYVSALEEFGPENASVAARFAISTAAMQSAISIYVNPLEIKLNPRFNVSSRTLKSVAKDIGAGKGAEVALRNGFREYSKDLAKAVYQYSKEVGKEGLEGLMEQAVDIGGRMVVRSATDIRADYDASVGAWADAFVSEMVGASAAAGASIDTRNQWQNESFMIAYEHRDRILPMVEKLHGAEVAAKLKESFGAADKVLRGRKYTREEKNGIIRDIYNKSTTTDEEQAATTPAAETEATVPTAEQQAPEPMPVVEEAQVVEEPTQPAAPTIYDIAKQEAKMLRLNEGDTYQTMDGTTFTVVRPGDEDIVVRNEDNGEEYSKSKQGVRNEITQMFNNVVAVNFPDMETNRLESIRRGMFDQAMQGALDDVALPALPAPKVDADMETKATQQGIELGLAEPVITRAVSIANEPGVVGMNVIKQPDRGDFTIEVTREDGTVEDHLFAYTGRRMRIQNRREAPVVQDTEIEPVAPASPPMQGIEEPITPEAPAATGPQTFTRATIEQAQGIDTTAIGRLMDTVSEVAPDLEVQLFDNSEQLQDAVGQRGNAFISRDGKTMYISKESDLTDLSHEVLHPILVAAELRKPGTIDAFYNEVMSRMPQRVIDDLEVFQLGYADRPVAEQREEVVVEFLARLASGQYGMDVFGKDGVIDKVIDFFAKMFNVLGITNPPSDIASLKRFAKKVVDAMRAGDVISFGGEVVPRRDMQPEAQAQEGQRPDVKARIIGEYGANFLDEKRKNLDLAKKMESGGKSPLNISLVTGWERGIDGKWRCPLSAGVELTSNGSSIISSKPDKSFINRLKDIIKDKELFSAYPGIEDMTIVFTNKPAFSFMGRYHTEGEQIVVNLAKVDNESELLNTVIHEVQHRIQVVEGFPIGSSSKDFDAYWRSAGEVEARNAAYRAVTPEVNRMPLDITEDVPRSEQIVLTEGDVQPSPDVKARFTQEGLSTQYQRAKKWMRDEMTQTRPRSRAAIITDAVGMYGITTAQAEVMYDVLWRSPATKRMTIPAGYQTERTGMGMVLDKIAQFRNEWLLKSKGMPIEVLQELESALGDNERMAMRMMDAYGRIVKIIGKLPRDEQQRVTDLANRFLEGRISDAEVSSLPLNLYAELRQARIWLDETTAEILNEAEASELRQEILSSNFGEYVGRYFKIHLFGKYKPETAAVNKFLEEYRRRNYDRISQEMVLADPNVTADEIEVAIKKAGRTAMNDLLNLHRPEKPTSGKSKATKPTGIMKEREQLPKRAGDLWEYIDTQQFGPLSLPPAPGPVSNTGNPEFEQLFNDAWNDMRQYRLREAYFVHPQISAKYKKLEQVGEKIAKIASKEGLIVFGTNPYNKESIRAAVENRSPFQFPTLPPSMNDAAAKDFSDLLNELNDGIVEISNQVYERVYLDMDTIMSNKDVLEGTDGFRTLEHLSPGIRALLGEIPPLEAMTITMANMARYTTMNKYYKTIRALGEGNFLFRGDDPRRPEWCNKKIPGSYRPEGAIPPDATSERMAPLSGMYTTDEIYELLMNAQAFVDYSVDPFYDAIRTMSGKIQEWKTVWSPQTQSRNFVSNFNFVARNMWDNPIRMTFALAYVPMDIAMRIATKGKRLHHTDKGALAPLKQMSDALQAGIIQNFGNTKWTVQWSAGSNVNAPLNATDYGFNPSVASDLSNFQAAQRDMLAGMKRQDSRGTIVSDAVTKYGMSEDNARALHASLLNRSFKDEMSDILNKLSAAGLLNSSVSMRVIADQMGNIDTRDKAVAYIANHMIFEDASPVRRAYAKAGQNYRNLKSLAPSLYSFGDDTFKIFGYLRERADYSKLLFGKQYFQLSNEQQLEVDNIAIENVKNLLPNYNRIGRLGKILSNTPFLGNFIAFKIESMRVWYNHFSLAGKEIRDGKRSGNSAMVRHGYKRLAGNAMMMGANTALELAFMNFMGGAVASSWQFLGNYLSAPFDDEDDDERKKLLRSLQPTWSQNDYIVPIDFSDPETGRITTISISANHPFGDFQRAMVAMDMNLSSQSEDNQTAYVMISEMFGQFVDPKIWVNTFTEIFSNTDAYGNDIYNESTKDYKGDDWETVLSKKIAYFIKRAGPGWVGQFSRVGALDPFLPHDEFFSEFRKPAHAASWEKELAGMMSGFRPTTVDIYEDFRRRVREYVPMFGKEGTEGTIYSGAEYWNTRIDSATFEDQVKKVVEDEYNTLMSLHNAYQMPLDYGLVTADKMAEILTGKSPKGVKLSPGNRVAQIIYSGKYTFPTEKIRKILDKRIEKDPTYKVSDDLVAWVDNFVKEKSPNENR